MSVRAVKLFLTGGREGKTVMLAKRQFVKGVHTVVGDEKTVAGAVSYMGRCYAAFPEGPELDAARGVSRGEGDEDGKRDLQANQQRSQEPAVQSGVQQGGGGTSEVSPDRRVGSTDAKTGAPGSLSPGNGHPDTGDDVETRKKERLAEALKKLDPSNDEHWTEAGLPRLDAVQSLFGQSVNRAEVTAAIPDFRRQA